MPSTLNRKSLFARIVPICAAVAFLFAGNGAADLRSYVQREDPSLAFTLDGTEEAGPVTLHHIRLTSQTWQGIPWQHWLTVIRPKDVQYPDKAMLFVTGGSNQDGRPSFSEGRDRMLVDMAAKSKAVVAVLRQVPNQPLFNGLTEDQIISYTFDKYLKGEGEDWPLLQPMVKSAVRAMDAVQQYAKATFKQDIAGFVVTGASKRGWTTWLTAAVDPRVVAIAPMVIDVLNMPVQMERQMRSYGRYSEEIQDYTEKGIQGQGQTPQGQKLNALVDPYSYRDALTMPKLLLLGTNDPYWTVDAANVYLKDLKGKTYIHYEPNAGHGLGPGAFPALLAFYQAILKGKDLPNFTVDSQPGRPIRVTFTERPEINIWLARSVTRDFRNAKWEKRSLADAPGAITDVGFSELGYAAYFAELVFTNDDGVTYSLSGPMTVLPPEVFPFDEKGTRIARSEPKGEPEGNPYAPENGPAPDRSKPQPKPALR